ncbi:MAG TPA: DUF402 domain-containing protein [Clostridiaceae bacterium]
MKQLTIKKDRFTCDVFKVIENKRYIQKKISNKEFNCYVALILLDSVTMPQTWNYNGEEIIFCDSGMKWLRILPENEDFTIMVVINGRDDMIAWYIDIIDGYGFDEDGIVYVNDLFLDLIVYPDGKIIIDDMDELEEALEQKVISIDMYEKALNTSERLQENILYNILKLNNFCMQCLNEIKQI